MWFPYYICTGHWHSYTRKFWTWFMCTLIYMAKLEFICYQKWRHLFSVLGRVARLERYDVVLLLLRHTKQHYKLMDLTGQRETSQVEYPGTNEGDSKQVYNQYSTTTLSTSSWRVKELNIIGPRPEWHQREGWGGEWGIRLLSWGANDHIVCRIL